MVNSDFLCYFLKQLVAMSAFMMMFHDTHTKKSQFGAKIGDSLSLVTCKNCWESDILAYACWEVSLMYKQCLLWLFWISRVDGTRSEKALLCQDQYYQCISWLWRLVAIIITFHLDVYYKFRHLCPLLLVMILYYIFLSYLFFFNSLVILYWITADCK